MPLNFLLVAIGGALGSMSRYGLGIVCKSWGALNALTISSTKTPAGVVFPWGTLGANIAGCFCIGVFSEWASSKAGLSPQAKLFLTTGFCGGFTTLSSLMLETNDLFRSGEWFVGSLYVVTSLVLPFLALWAGIAVVKAFPSK